VNAAVSNARNGLKPPARLVGAMLLHDPLIKRAQHRLHCFKLRRQLGASRRKAGFLKMGTTTWLGGNFES
jgi:hypothetical protein